MRVKQIRTETNVFDLNLVARFSKCVLNFTLSEETPIALDKESISVLLECIDKKNEIFAIIKQKSTIKFSVIDLTIKNECIDFVKTLLPQKDILDYYSSAQLNIYSDMVEKYLNILESGDILYFFTHIIETIGLQCSEMQFVYDYTASLIRECRLDKSVQDELNSKVKDAKKQAEEALDHTNEIDQKIDKKIQEFNEQHGELNEATRLAKKATKEAKDASNDASKKITETSVTVLGMFTGIVMAIVAALAFSSSVLDNINASNFYRLLCVASLVGLVCFHLMAFMFRWIAKIRDSYSEKKYVGKLQFQSKKLSNDDIKPQDSDKAELQDSDKIKHQSNAKHPCNFIKKLRKSDWMSVVFNVCLIVVMLTGFILQFIFPADCKHPFISDWEIEQYASCGDSGNKYIRCNICDEVIKKEILPKLEHDFKRIVLKESSCSEDGLEYQQCKLCGESTDFISIPSKEHDFKIVVAPEPNCISEGMMYQQCQNCKEIVEPQMIAAMGHHFEAIIDQEPTCTEDGYIHQECTNCGTITYPEIVAAIGHNYKDVIDKIQTKTETGLKHKECSICGEITPPEIIPVI